MLAKQIMRERVITLSPSMTTREAAEAFHGHDITGAPVVDAAGGVLGVVSHADLSRHLGEPDRVKVSDVMNPRVACFDEEMPLQDLAGEMLSRRISRALITRGGRLCGIVTYSDLVRALVPLARDAMGGSLRDDFVDLGGSG